MIDLSKFKPNLIPSPKGRMDEYESIINKNGGHEQYLAFNKKDGVRMVLKNGDIMGRSLKAPGSREVIARFQELADACKEENIIIEGEFYKHGWKLNQINRFFKKSGFTDADYKLGLEKAFAKSPSDFNTKYDGLSIEDLTTFHDDLEFWMFDAVILDRPDLTEYFPRMIEALNRLARHPFAMSHFKTSPPQTFKNQEQLDALYQKALADGYEGLILNHKAHEYKFGRSSLNEGTLLKMKNDSIEFDGIVLDVMESTVVRDGAEKTENELGRSVTSKKKADRLPSGMAKGFLVEYEGLGTFTVGLKGFSHEMRKELLENKEQYIGRSFRYTGMQSNKDFPLIAYFDCWRDDK